jgi:glycosyltransferase involved in cell wall biosynthesis
MSTPIRPPRRILYIHHAGLGGSAISLYYTVTALDRERWEPVVALIKPARAVAELYWQAGIECVEWSGIATLEHTTARYLRCWSPVDWAAGVGAAAKVRRSIRRTRELVEATAPDVVHLNSVVLSAAAMALRDGDVPWVWHVRESPVRGATGTRTRLLGQALARWPDETIFISEADRRAWVGGRTGTVVHNFVDLQRFHPATEGRRAELGIAEAAPAIAYMGGIAAIKGVLPLLQALQLLRMRIPDLRCIMPGTVYEQSRALVARAARAILPLLGGETLSQRARRAMEPLGDTCILLPFETDIAPLLASADIVVFPATRPHFPRPAMEAAAMGKPVVASRLPGVSEVVEDGRTGILVEPGNAEEMAAAIERLVRDPDLRRRMGAAGRARAEAMFDQSIQCRRIANIYERVCAA